MAEFIVRYTGLNHPTCNGNYSNKIFEFKKGVRNDLCYKSMETRKHSGWLEIAYQSLISTFCQNLWLANLIKKCMTKSRD